MADIAVAAADRIIRKATGLRVSEKAAKYMVEVLEEIGAKIAEEAGNLAKHAKRKTFKLEDIKLALKNLGYR